jgi:hypothetical protein
LEYFSNFDDLRSQVSLKLLVADDNSHVTQGAPIHPTDTRYAWQRIEKSIGTRGTFVGQPQSTDTLPAVAVSIQGSFSANGFLKAGNNTTYIIPSLSEPRNSID